VATAYWAKVDKRGADECWPWLGATTKYPRGQIRISGKTRIACRIGWELVHGTPPGELAVLHTCDNAMCHNPKHWFLGTQQENLADMRAKGRGKGAPRVTTPELDAEIIRLLDEGLSRREISNVLNIGRYVVNQRVKDHLTALH
jgi:hypothetical protein